MRALLLIGLTGLLLLGGLAAPQPTASAPASGGAAVVGPGVAPGPLPGRRAAADYQLPLAGAPAVVRGFDPPLVRYGPGHLGVDLRAASGAVVLAAGAGEVTFAGVVAGRGVVVVTHPDGVRTEYEPVRARVHAGQQVAAGQPIGMVDGVHRGCTGACLHWGARRGTVYFDPFSLLRALGPVRLLPWGSPARGP